MIICTITCKTHEQLLKIVANIIVFKFVENVSLFWHLKPCLQCCMHLWGTRGEGLLEMEDVGTWQGLELLVLLADGLATHAAVELQLLHTLQEFHYLLPQLALLPLLAENPLVQAVHLQRVELPYKGVVGGGVTQHVLADVPVPGVKTTDNQVFGGSLIKLCQGKKNPEQF